MLNNMKALLGILILVAGLAYWVMRENHNDNQPTEASPLMPTWQENPDAINAIDRIEVAKGTDFVALDKRGDDWVLNDGFYADTAPISTLVQSLKRAQIKEAKTANPDNHAQLDLAETGLKVRLYEGDKLRSGVHIGKRSTSGLTFVRRMGEDQTYAVEGMQPINANPSNWQLKTVIDVPSEQVEGISFAPAEGDEWQVVRTGDNGDLQLAQVPEGQQLKSTTALTQLANGLTKLVVNEALPVDVNGMEAHHVVTYELSGGQQVVLRTYAKDEQHYLTVEATDKPGYSDWMFEIPAYKFDALNPVFEELLEPLAEAIDSESADSDPAAIEQADEVQADEEQADEVQPGTGDGVE